MQVILEKAFRMQKNNYSNFKFLLKSMGCASVSGCLAELASIPFQTIKVRLHVQGIKI